MADTDSHNPDSHIGPEFREAFPSWSEFRSYVTDRARAAEFNADRALHQILTGDFAARLMNRTPHDWIIFGSLALPSRPATDFSWPADFLPAQPNEIHPAYVMARSAFDLDLCALDITESYGVHVKQAVDAVTVNAGDTARAERGLGLGGLVRYSADVRVYDSGKIMGVIVAQPIDPRYGPGQARPVDDPIGLEIDIKPPDRVPLFGPAHHAERSIVGIAVPGLAPVTPMMYPTASQLADKISMLSGPAPGSSRQVAPGPRHRYKDLFDIHYMIRTCSVEARHMREALEVNNQVRFGRDGLPHPYHVYGAGRRPGELDVPWRSAVNTFKADQPQLARYPDFDAMERAAAGFVAELTTASPTSTWAPGRGWSPPRSDLHALAFPRPPSLRPGPRTP
ncbi:nucleotidyl transferase AbiEii/AbiGii toxin family protein, partial [Frankia sp. KB5]